MKQKINEIEIFYPNSNLTEFEKEILQTTIEMLEKSVLL